MSDREKDGPAPRLTRRSLLQAPLAGAAVAATAAAGDAAAAAEPPLPEDPRQPRFHKTPHVQTYYDRARG